MNINIKLNPEDFGKSGELALCVYCGKATEYKICCDAIDGLIPVNSENLYDLVFSYSLNTYQVEELEQAVTDFEARN